MALADLSFKFYTDDGLVTPYSGTTNVSHNTDLSDNPQDFVLYFGSNEADRVLEAASNPGVDDIEITPTDILPEWAAATAYVLGDHVEPTVDNTYTYDCTTAGTSHASVEPTWPTTIGVTVADGTVVWTCVAKNHPTTEIKLATTSGGLAAATGGAALSLGTSIDSGVANAVEVHFRITNTVTTASSTINNAELSIAMNNVIESVV